MHEDLYDNLKTDVINWRKRDPNVYNVRFYCDGQQCQLPNKLVDEDGNETLHGVHFLKHDYSYYALLVITLDNGMISKLNFYPKNCDFDSITIKFKDEIIYRGKRTDQIKTIKVNTVEELYSYVKEKYAGITSSGFNNEYFNLLPHLLSVQQTIDRINPVKEETEIVIDI